jgi:hypothetical protein
MFLVVLGNKEGLEWHKNVIGAIDGTHVSC